MLRLPPRGRRGSENPFVGSSTWIAIQDVVAEGQFFRIGAAMVLRFKVDFERVQRLTDRGYALGSGAGQVVKDHPGIRFPQAVEADYDLHEGVLRMKTRAALAGYVLRRWSIDSTDDHSLDPASHHLWLRNPQALYGVESASLAPGRTAEPQKANQ